VYEGTLISSEDGSHRTTVAIKVPTYKITYRVGHKQPNHFQKFATHLYNDTEKRSVYQYQYFVENKTNIVTFVAIKYSLHKSSDTALC